MPLFRAPYYLIPSVNLYSNMGFELVVRVWE